MNVSAAQTIQDVTPASTNKPSHWVAVTITLQLLWAVALIALSAYLLVLATGHPPERAAGLRLSAAMIALPGLIAAAGGLGLWNRQRWGWWLSLVCDWAIVAAMVYGIIDDVTYGLLDWSLVAATVLAMIVPILLLFPVVRGAYRHRDTSTESVSSE